MESKHLQQLFIGRDVGIAFVVIGIIYFITTFIPLPGYFLRLLYEGLSESLGLEWGETLFFAGQFVFIYGLAVIAGGISQYVRGRLGVDSRDRNPFLDVTLPLAAVITLIGVILVSMGLPLLSRYPNWNVGAIGVSIGLGLAFLLLAAGLLRYLAGYSGNRRKEPRPS